MFLSFALIYALTLSSVLLAMQYNDNNGNQFSDVFWLGALVQAIGELEFGQQVGRKALNLYPCMIMLIC